MKKTLCIILAVLMLAGLPAVAAGAGAVGEYLYTDIVCTINGQPIRSYNVGGYTYVVAEELRDYGFDVAWNAEARSLDVEFTGAEAAGSASKLAADGKLFTAGGEVFATDILAYVAGSHIAAYNLGGETLINTEALDVFGWHVYDNAARTLDITCKRQPATLATVTVDGVEGAQGGGEVSETRYMGLLSSLTTFDNYPYRAGLYVRNGALDEAGSVLAAVKGEYSDKIAKNIEVNSLSDDFSAIIVNNSTYSVSGASINMPTDADGKLTNDFVGLGAAVFNSNGGFLTIEDSTIYVSGVGKLALVTDTDADTIVKNSTLRGGGGTIYEGYYCNADQLMMIAPPWVLGLDDTVANARTTNLMGNFSTQTFVDCEVYARGWGALSTDSAAENTMQHLTAVNTSVVVEESGYGAYAIEAVEDYYGVSMDVATYGVIMTGGEVNFRGYTGGQSVDITKFSADSPRDSRYIFFEDGVEDGLRDLESGVAIASVKSEKVAEGTVVPSVISSDNFGFMCHYNATSAWNVINILDGTRIHTGDAVFLVKKVNGDFHVDSSTLKSDSGVIMQIIDNDDDYVGVNMGLNWGLDLPEYGRCVGSTNIEDMFAGLPCHFPTFNERLAEPAGWSYEWTAADMSKTAAGLNTTGDSGWNVNLTVTNSALKGDIWNSSGYVTENGGSTMNITLGEGASLEGIVSAGAFRHTIQNDKALYIEDKSIDAGGYYEALVGNAYAEKFGGAADWSNAELLGHVESTQYSNGWNVSNVVLENGAVWTVTGECLLDSLTLDAASTLAAPEGKTLTLTVNGAEVTVAAGSYEGDIVLNIE